MGKRDELDGEKARVAAAGGRRPRQGASARSRSPGTRPTGWPAPIVEGTLLKLYEFDSSRPPENDDDEDDDETASAAWRWRAPTWTRPTAAAAIAAHAANPPATCRTCPRNVATPDVPGRARRGDRRTAHDDLELEVLGREEIEAAKGMGAFAASPRAATPSRKLIVLRYDGGGNGPHLGYVGKAVTFDTGGISLKPGAKMSEMKFDMSGGAAVLEAMGAIAELALPVKITAVVPRHREHAQRPRRQARRHRDRRRTARRSRSTTPTPRAG